MKLLYITNQICGSGGLERVLSIKASYLADKLGYEIHIITLDQNNTPLFYDFSEKLHYHDIKTNARFFKYLKGIKTKVKEIKPDIISVCDDGLKGFYLPHFLKKPCPMIYERHASKDIFKNSNHSSFFQKIKLSLYNILMNYGGKKYNSFVVLTNNNLKEWKLNNLKVIANPLSFFPEKKADLINKKVIVVGSHNYQKGFDRLLKIWTKVLIKYPDWKLEIYGKIDSNKTYLKLANKLKVNDSINFHQPVKNIKDKYREASIYAMTSRSEGFGMVLIEAMANGVPCISFNCPGGPKDIITDKVDGFLIENDNIESYTNHLTLLIENSQLRKEMGEKAKSKAKKYLPEIIVPQWDLLFKKLIQTS